VPAVETDSVAVVAVATDGSEPAGRAVRWAATLARAHGARLHAVQVVSADDDTDRAVAVAALTEYAAGVHDPATAQIVAGDDVAELIVAEAERVEADVLVVGNNGMRGRRAFLLGNVANRVTHLARCTVTVVNTTADGGTDDDVPVVESRRRDRRAEEIVRALGPTVLTALAGRALRRGPDEAGPRRLREAFEELGPTFGKLGQMLSTRPDLVAPEYIAELQSLQSSVPPMTEPEVVAVMEEELGVPWEDVFGSIDPAHVAAGTIGQVHRATLADGHRVVVKVQRPGAQEIIDRDLTLLESVVRPFARVGRVGRVVDLPSVVEQLSASLRAELDFTLEAANLDEMAELLAPYEHLRVPACHHGLTSRRLLVMDEIVGGVPLAEAPEGPERQIAARELLHAFYQQVLDEGFFHADPHPGNLMWADDRIWLLDLGMVGRLDAEARRQLMLLLLAFAQGDGGMIADVALDLAGGGPAHLDRLGFEDALGELSGSMQGTSLSQLNFAELLNKLAEISLRYGVPLPSSLVMVGKAVGQVQLTVAEIAPEVDPLEEASRYFGRSMLRRAIRGFDPQEWFYRLEKLRYTAGRITEDLASNRHGPAPLHNLERTVAHAGRSVALGLTAGLSWIAAAAANDSAGGGRLRRLAQVVATASTTALVLELSNRDTTRRGRR
jgi:predicted unusual protein kinase regulating ubiquinone biosynthesis (AarF/ABC1/UbiB family)/nucleotide-binding universal stress UspA family protein